MPSLSETQAAFRDAITGGPAAGLLPRLCCPAEVGERLEIYRRHHRESFRRHLCGRYPTLEWLLGTAALDALADATLARHPPLSPSLAAYGAELIETLAEDTSGHPAYAPDVARLDWQLGGLAVAVAAPPLAIAGLAAIDPLQLPQTGLALQPGLAFLACAWPVDRLFEVSQQDQPPAELAFAPEPIHLQLRGARGRIGLARLTAGGFAFRRSLAAGCTLGTAAGEGTAADPAFDLPAALAGVFAEGLVIDLTGENPHA